MQHTWLFLVLCFLFLQKTKKYFPICHKIRNYQTFLACIIVYQLVQGRCPHSDNPLENESVQNESTLVNYKIVLEWTTQYCMQKAKFFWDSQGRIQRFLKGKTLYIGHNGWSEKKILYFRWSKEAEITLETIKVFGKIFLSVFSNFLLFYW